MKYCIIFNYIIFYFCSCSCSCLIPIELDMCRLKSVIKTLISFPLCMCECLPCHVSLTDSQITQAYKHVCECARDCISAGDAANCDIREFSLYIMETSWQKMQCDTTTAKREVHLHPFWVFKRAKKAQLTHFTFTHPWWFA